MAGQVVKLPRSRGNILEEYQRQALHQELKQDPRVQDMWKRYKKLTKGSTRMDQESWLDFNYAAGPNQQLSRYMR